MKGKIAIIEDQFIEANDLKLKLIKAGYTVCGIAASYAEAVRLIELEKPDMVLVDIFLKGDQTGIELGIKLGEMNIAFIYISANADEQTLIAAKETKPHGFIVKPYREKDLMVTMEIAQYRYNNNVEEKLKRDLFLQREFNTAAFLKTTLNQKLLHITKALQQYLPFDLITISSSTENPVLDPVSFLRIGYDEYQVLNTEQLKMIAPPAKNASINRTAYFHKGVSFYNGNDFQQLTRDVISAKLAYDNFNMRSHIVIPLCLSNKKLPLYFALYSKRSEAYTKTHTSLVEQFREPLSKAISDILSLQEVVQNPKEERKYSIPNNKVNFGSIIGNSPALLNTLDIVMQVALVNTSVLILGESGTGKESIAASIHKFSQRSKHPFIKINCAALPASLIESELFGYEKGSFTGALETRLGKFEQAHKGTIFLDEIGELPIELQPKLLRILQEREIERIGGKSTVKLDIRIIAATNRNLEKEVAEGKFRLDLYYRLNIFPITMPPLRERKEDIPELLQHFLKKFNDKFGKNIVGISRLAMEQSMEYDWPGNIRELENSMERAVLLARGSSIEELVVSSSYSIDNSTNSEAFKTIDDNEREHIVRALRKCNGKVWGQGGAAELLNLPPSTLSSKMKKFGITRNNL